LSKPHGYGEPAVANGKLILLKGLRGNCAFTGDFDEEVTTKTYIDEFVAECAGSAVIYTIAALALCVYIYIYMYIYIIYYIIRDFHVSVLRQEVFFTLIPAELWCQVEEYHSTLVLGNQDEGAFHTVIVLLALIRGESSAFIGHSKGGTNLNTL
jgi:hypothetical protein